MTAEKKRFGETSSPKRLLCLKLVLLVADVSFLSGIESQVADGSDQGVDTAGDVTQNQVCPSSGGVACGLQGGVVDDQATDPAQEEGQQEANQIVVIHNASPPFSIYEQIVTFLSFFVKRFDIREKRIWESFSGGVRGICCVVNFDR